MSDLCMLRCSEDGMFAKMLKMIAMFIECFETTNLLLLLFSMVIYFYY
jgi:hypothetical protein